MKTICRSPLRKVLWAGILGVAFLCICLCPGQIIVQEDAEDFDYFDFVYDGLLTNNWASGGDFSLTLPPDANDTACENDSGFDPDCEGMARWKVTQPFCMVSIKDTPWAYQPALGSRTGPTLTFKQNDLRGGRLAGKTYSVGFHWNLNWFSAVAIVGQTNLVWFAPGGGEVLFVRDSLASSIFSSRHSPARITWYSTEARFDIAFPSGALETYTNVVQDSANVEYFLISKRSDPAGRATKFLYETNSGVLRLINVQDPDGLQTTLHYGYTGRPAYVTSIESPYDQVAHLYYETNVAGRVFLTNITDAIGVSSKFAYTGNLITTLTTPYGATSFEAAGWYRKYGTNILNPAFRFDAARLVFVTEPNNAKHLYLYRSLATNDVPDRFASADDYPDSPVGSLDIDRQDERNSFHWGPRQYALINANFLANRYLTNLVALDYRKAHREHWLQTLNVNTNAPSPVLSWKRTPSPGNDAPGVTIWFDYYGKPTTRQEGTNAIPAAILQLLSNGSTKYAWFRWNEWSHPTNVVSTWSQGGSVLLRTNEYIYDSNNIDLLKVIGVSGQVMASLRYNTNHQVMAVTNAVGDWVTNQYLDATAQLDRQYTSAGLTIGYDYLSDTHRLSAIDYQEISGQELFTYFTSWKPASFTTLRGTELSYKYDGLGRLLETSYPGFGTITNSFANTDRPFNLSGIRNRLGNWTYFSHNSKGQLTTLTNALVKVTTYNYCDCGALESITDALTNTTSYTYFDDGRSKQVVHPTGGGSETYGYDSLGRLIAVTNYVGQWLTVSYNNQGVIRSVSNAVGRLLLLEYDIFDRVTNRVDGNGIAVAQGYDLAGRSLWRRDPASGTEYFGYGSRGLVAYTNQLGQISRYAYDEARRLKVVTNGAGSAIESIVYLTNSAAGDLLALRDAKSQNTFWTYDSEGRVTVKRDHLGNTNFMLAVNANGWLTNRWTPAKGSTRYGYDAVGNLSSIDYPNSTDISFQYDAINQLISMTDAVGTTTLGWKAYGALANEDGPWNDDKITYSYTTARERQSFALQQPYGSDWQQTYSYDSVGRLTTISSPHGAFTYDYGSGPGNLIKRLNLPSGAYVTNSYDSVGHLLSTLLKDGSGNILNGHTYGYNSGHERTNQWRLCSGTVSNQVAYLYDTLGQLTNAFGYETNGTPRIQERLTYRYDLAGNLQTRVSDRFTNNFTVNGLNQLSTEVSTGAVTVAGFTTAEATSVTVNGNAAIQYTDLAFARTNLSWSSGSNAFTAVAQDSFGRNDTNAISALLWAANSFSYDANGNLTNVTAGSTVVQSFVFDDENQLVAITTPSVCLSSNVYDGFRRLRIRREFVWSGGAWQQTNEVRYVYDGRLPVQHRHFAPLASTTIPSVVQSFTRGLSKGGGIGGLLAFSEAALGEAGSPAYYHSDGGGNVTALIASNNLVVARYLYDPYGNQVMVSGSLASANPYRFSSKEWHAPSGLSYYLYRWYSPQFQRWVNRDPIAERGGFNLYRFSRNSPTLNVDKYGLDYSFIASGTFGPFPAPSGPMQYVIGDTFIENMLASVTDIIPLVVNTAFATADVTMAAAGVGAESFKNFETATVGPDGFMAFGPAGELLHAPIAAAKCLGTFSTFCKAARVDCKAASIVANAGENRAFYFRPEGRAAAIADGCDVLKPSDKAYELFNKGDRTLIAQESMDFASTARGPVTVYLDPEAVRASIGSPSILFDNELAVLLNNPDVEIFYKLLNLDAKH